MTAYYLTRVKTGVANVLYYMFVFSMIVPFQMVMFTMSKLANMTHLNNPPGMVLLYLGFGSGLSVFMFCGFIKSIPLDLLWCRNADLKAYCHHRRHPECHVDLERLSAALSGDRPEY